MSPTDESAVLALLFDSLAGGPTGERTPEFFRWKHEQSPFGSSPTLVAEHEGKVVGLRTFMRWEFGVGDETVRAVRAVDTATDEAHRGRGIFRLLTLALVDDLTGKIDFIFNTPNSSSLPGYLKMGWQQVGDVPIHVRPVRLVRFLRGIRSAREVTPASDEDRSRCPLPGAGDVLEGLTGLDGLLDDVLAGDAASGALHTRRTADYLRWRYVDAPGLDYRAMPLTSGGTLQGLAIARPRRRGALRELTLSELLVRPGDTVSARRLLAGLRRSGCDHVAAHFAPGTAGAATATRSGYLRAPIGMTLTTRVLGDPPADPRLMDSWRLSVGDLEVF
jgi:GNAT superfamily N-acetyltransferase